MAITGRPYIADKAMMLNTAAQNPS